MARAAGTGRSRTTPPPHALPNDPAWLDGPSHAAISAFVRGEGMRWLAVPNIVGVSVVPKQRGGVTTGEMAVVFDVVAKFPETPEIVRAGSRRIPPTIAIDGHVLPTDVVEAWPEPHAKAPDLKARMDPVRGGCSAGNGSQTGTLGAIVRDAASGALLGLSNWHVLMNSGFGGATAQPGPGDWTGAATASALGKVVRSVFDAAVDGAVTTLGPRGADPSICMLDVAVSAVAAPAAQMRVVKCGKETGVTHGIVTTAEKAIKLAMPGVSQPYGVSVCIIKPDTTRPAAGPISAVGDSGSCWMLVGADGLPTGTMIGLHLAGGGPAQAYACHADRVFERLAIVPAGPVAHEFLTAMSAPDIALAPAFGAAPALAQYQVIARRGLRVRGGPGTQFEILGARPYRDVVSVIAQEGDWMLVDLKNDGIADGFMLAALLRPVV